MSFLQSFNRHPSPLPPLDAAPQPHQQELFAAEANQPISLEHRMVESEPPLKHKQDCDVKDDRVLNGCGSKDLELGILGNQKDPVKALSDGEKNNDKADFEKAIELARYL